MDSSYGIAVGMRKIMNTNHPVEHLISKTGRRNNMPWVWTRRLVCGVPEDGSRCFPSERQAVITMLDYLGVSNAKEVAEEVLRLPNDERSEFLQGKFDAEWPK